MEATWRSYLWGKTVRKPDLGQPDWHPLFCHLMDVAVVAEAILNDPSADHWVQRLAAALGADAAGLKQRLPFLIGIHDLAKASPGFAAKSPAHYEVLRSNGAPLPAQAFSGLRHDLELGRVLAGMLPAMRLFTPEGTNERRFWNSVSLGITAHHGRFFKPAELRKEPEIPLEPYESWHQAWVEARNDLAARLRELLGTPVDPLPCHPGNLSAVAMLLNGFTILCDWIGSDATVFPAKGLVIDLTAYTTEVRKKAQAAVGGRRLLAFPSWVAEPEFRSLFPEREEIRSVQQALDRDALPQVPAQFLAVVEAPMGEGKTEAAELLACRLAWRGGCRGFYFALPTVATSNQMYGRVGKLLRKVGGDSVLALVNGLAEFHPEIEAELRRAPGAVAHDEDQTARFDAWYLPRKRSLLAAYGVGTIDQALLGALNTRHVGLRLFGLAGKVVIVDEVHAYDLYMSEILDTLLAWLKELGASVVLLSATLPSSRREQLLQTFARPGATLPDDCGGPDAPYPLITLAERDGKMLPLRCVPASRRLTVELERHADGEANRRENAEWLLSHVRGGGRAVWICNTVAEAQAVYSELRRQASEGPDDRCPEIILFHARFPQGERRAIEDDVLRRFGPPPEGADPPGAERPVVLVATQVVEQSLDLDFDLMMSQLAPVDLLLQRLGRLWRHAERRDRGGIDHPRLALLLPDTGPDGPRFGSYGAVYSPLVLLHTLLVLADKEALELPCEIRTLVEGVYGVAPVPEEDDARAADLEVRWFAAALKEQERTAEEQRQEAATRVLRPPDPDGSFAGPQAQVVEEEAEGSHLAMQTRLGRETVRVALLPTEDPLWDRLLRLGTADPHQAREVVKETLDRSVSLGYVPLVKWLKQERRLGNTTLYLPAVESVNALRGTAVLGLTAGRHEWRFEQRDYWLRLDPDLGVVYDRDEETVE